jgi:hypothetical protein
MKVRRHSVEFLLVVTAERWLLLLNGDMHAFALSERAPWQEWKRKGVWRNDTALQRLSSSFNGWAGAPSADHGAASTRIFSSPRYIDSGFGKKNVIIY